MHDQVGVSPDRRREMRVAPQVEAEMAIILRRIFRLRLRAQHHLVDKRFVILAADLAEHAIEQGRAQGTTLRKRQIKRFQEFLEIMNLLLGRFVVYPIDKRQRLLFKHFGRGDVGEDHEFLDQPVGVEPLRHDDAID